MEPLLHRSPSVGKVVKKIMEINPELSSHDVIAIVRQAIRAQGGAQNEFSQAETLDEARALELARATLKH